MSVFADTSSLYAAVVRSEERHRECLALFEKLLIAGRVIQTTNYVVLETTALLQHRIGLDPVRDFDQRVLPLINVHWVSSDLHQRGMRRLLRENERTLSLTDSVSFEFMEAAGLRDAFSLDRHFADAGFRLLTR
jgi:predicted nucleic acid-binding protein